MQSSYRRLSILSGFVLMLVVLIGNDLVTRHELGIQVANEIWVAHTRQVLLELSQTESLIKDAETGQRGFLFTEDPKYLADYQSAIHQLQPSIDRLGQLTADNLQEQSQVAQLRDLSRAKLSELGQTISLYRSGDPEKAKELVKSDQGFILMNNIRRLVSEMRREQASLEGTRSLAYQKSIKITNACVYVSSLIAVLGLILLCYSILRQIELRERNARQMKQRDEWFRVTLTSLGDAVMTTDPEGMVTFLNPVAEELIGLGIATVKGRPIGEVFQIFNESTHQPVENPINEVLNSGKVVSLANHTVLKRTDGEMVPIEDSAAPIRDSCDQIIGAVLVFRDATLERRARDILRNSEKFAAAARIAASIAHEIHNPLDSVVNLLYLLKHDPSPEERAEFIDMAQGELARVTEISRAMLCMHRESRTPVLLDLSSVLRSVMVLMERSMTEAGITVRTKLASNAVLSGYPAELRQVFSNILDNAVEASSPGGRIEVSVLSTGPRRARGKAAATLGGVVVTIADHGHGIPAKLLMDLFQPFFTTKGERGTGLGLWISRSVVEKHGGTITVESRTSPEDHGTTFTIFLPHSDAVQEAASTVDNSDKHKSEAEPHPEPKAAAAA